MLFHALASVVVAKFGQQSDVVLGAAVAGRNLPDTEHLVGFFAHALPLRYQVNLISTPNQLLRATTSAALTALEHQRMPLQEIVRALGIESKQGISPLLQAIVTVDNYPLDLTAFPGLTVSLEITQNTNSLADMTFNFAEGDDLQLTLQYDSSLFAPDTAQRLLHACDRLLDFFLEQPDRSLSAAVLLSAKDRAALERIWVELAGTPLDFSSRTAETLLDSPHWPALIDHVEEHGLLPALLMAL
jgi:non-ribosomal peptide synthetase component F